MAVGVYITPPSPGGLVARQRQLIQRPLSKALQPRRRSQAWPRCKLVPQAVLTPTQPKAIEEEAAAPERTVYTTYVGSTLTNKVKVVVLGSGWAAMSLVKALKKRDCGAYDITVVSPRNYFLYTPLLPAVATGTIEERSIVEPVRRILGDKGTYFEAVCHEIFPEEQAIVACFPKDAGMDEACFKVPYDILICAVGSDNNTFGIKGVREHAFFFKSVEDANRLRRQVSECFERASLPHTPDKIRKQLLSFVIVGGGPTGIEVAAELHDMITGDLSKIYPQLMGDVNIRIIELQDHILSTYDREISNYTQQQFGRSGITLVLNSKVDGVGRNSVTIVNNQSSVKEEIPFGACVWATGVAMHPLIKQLQQRLPPGSQSHFRSILTDGYLRVKGSCGTIFALGDDATIDQPKSLDKAQQLFDEFDADGNGRLSLDELRALLKSASQEYSHLSEHARFLEGKRGAKRWGNTVAKAVEAAKIRRQGAAASVSPNPLESFDEEIELTAQEFADLLSTIDRGLRALPATAQVARQQGEYLAGLLKQGLGPHGEVPEGAVPFRYGHKGSLAYIGGDKAVMDVPNLGPIKGLAAGLLWRGFETYSQFSIRNILLVSMDWVRTKIFGRDISRF